MELKKIINLINNSDMKTLQQIFDIIENNEISIDNYKEKGKLCGYELNTYTSKGVNEIIFLDFRKPNQDPKNPKHFIAEFESWLNCETIDEKIERNRQDPGYRNAFTIKESLIDFKNYHNNLKDVLSEIKGINRYCIESKVTRTECIYITAKNRKEAMKIAKQNESLNWETTHDEERQLVSIS